MIMSSMELSDKLEKYLKKIETETGREIKIQEIPSKELYRMKAAFVHHPKYISILLASGCRGIDPEIEQSIAHEATHGLLVYKRGYSMGFFKRPPSAKEKKIVTLLFTMVNDIVINKVIQEKGFLPYSPKYPSIVNEEIRAMKNGMGIYDEYSDDLSYMEKYMAFRYILAWGYLNYLELDPEVHKTLREYTKNFRNAYPEQYKMARKILGIIFIFDIFAAEGQLTVIEKMLNLWELEDLVELRTF